MRIEAITGYVVFVETHFEFYENLVETDGVNRGNYIHAYNVDGPCPVKDTKLYEKWKAEIIEYLFHDLAPTQEIVDRIYMKYVDREGYGDVKLYKRS